MKFEVTDAFRADRSLLSESERRLVAEVLPTFVAACDRYAADPTIAWPSSLRVKDVEGAPGVFEMTWSFSGPDGRATFEWIQIDGDLAVRWRRIGRHGILRNPQATADDPILSPRNVRSLSQPDKQDSRSVPRGAPRRGP